MITAQTYISTDDVGRLKYAGHTPNPIQEIRNDENTVVVVVVVVDDMNIKE